MGTVVRSLLGGAPLCFPFSSMESYSAGSKDCERRLLSVSCVVMPGFIEWLNGEVR